MSASRSVLQGFVVVLLILLAGAVLDARAEPAEFVLIAHPSVPAAEIDHSFVSSIFLKLELVWSDGTPMRPVDLAASSSVRKAFSRSIHRKSPAAIRSYWQKIIFSGRGIPPPEILDEDQVAHYVSQTPGAIAYVSPKRDLRGVKILTLLD